MLKCLTSILVVLVLSACTSLKVVKVDAKTGYFPSDKKATLVTKKPIDLDARKSLILVPDSDFEASQIRNIGYFEEVMNFSDLERKIITANLGDKVPSVTERIGVNNAAKYYKNFLWFRFERRGSGQDKQVRFILTDALTMEDYFVTETNLGQGWPGGNDRNNWYPMFNAFIDYIKENSKSFRK